MFNEARFPIAAATCVLSRQLGPNRIKIYAGSIQLVVLVISKGFFL
jgi:hypothetical protein